MTSASINGRWTYRSFHHAPIVVVDGQVNGTPELAQPWSPLGVLDATTDADGRVTGTLTFAPGVALQVDGHVHPASERVPASVEMVGAGLGSVNRIKGYFVPGSDHVVGTILCVANDLLKLPNGTVGPFVLHPLKAA